jgi:hypothetical protein
LSASTAERLFESGREAATAFLDGDAQRPKWDFEEYMRRWRSASSQPTAEAAAVG